ncbi:MAG: hypothetical protein WCL06_00015 [Bacteroidota bacterium]
MEYWQKGILIYTVMVVAAFVFVWAICKAGKIGTRRQSMLLRDKVKWDKDSSNSEFRMQNDEFREKNSGREEQIKNFTTEHTEKNIHRHHRAESYLGLEQKEEHTEEKDNG